MNSEEPLTNRAEPLLLAWEKRLASGEISEAQWYGAITAEITPAYLSSDNPRAQPGFIGDEAHWIQVRGIIADAIDRAGTFFDVGCANGYLMESVVRWSEERGYRLEPYGLDISPDLIAVALKRLPHWADHLYVGNAMDWEPTRRFDFVRLFLDFVADERRTK